MDDETLIAADLLEANGFLEQADVLRHGADIGFGGTIRMRYRKQLLKVFLAQVDFDNDLIDISQFDGGRRYVPGEPAVNFRLQGVVMENRQCSTG